MARVQFTRHLRRFFPNLEEMEVEATTVRQLISALDARHPGLAAYLVDDRGALRRHVNVFVEDVLIHDREALSDPLRPDSNVYILQALSGG
jgi:molybdopterin synthase sulfur carrier subunit